MARPHSSAHVLILCSLVAALAAPPAHARDAGGRPDSWTTTLQVLAAGWWPWQVDATLARAAAYVSDIVHHGLPAVSSAGKLHGHREHRGGRRNPMPIVGIGCAGNASDPNGPCG